MEKVKVSVIIPVHNAEKHLQECLQCGTMQSLKEMEIICVDDGSTDSSMDILRHVAKQDRRLAVLSAERKGAGVARNLGLERATGEYVIFLDSDDQFSFNLLELSYANAVNNQSDLVVFDYKTLDAEGNVTNCEGIHADYLPDNQTIFSYKDCPEKIMNIITSTPCNKLYRRNFLLEHQLKYEEINSADDITFSAVSVAVAERISFIRESLVEHRIRHTGTSSSKNIGHLNNVIIAVSSAVRQTMSLPYHMEIKHSIQRFAIENLAFALKNQLVNLGIPEIKSYYEYVHEYFNTEFFSDITEKNIKNILEYKIFLIIKKQNYDTMKRMTSRKVIASLTSYPARMDTLHLAIESIISQTHKADDIILWLAQDQFPNREEDLPDTIKAFLADRKLTIRWCKDLKPHKKYFYAMQEFPEALIITFDDDLMYGEKTIEDLYFSYLLWPNAVSTVRAHLITFDDHGKCLPYRYWIKEVDAHILTPSMQFLATGVAGVLYPPGLFKTEMFDENAILETCLWADDLWLKAMQIVSKVPVVIAKPHERLKYIPGSQKEALCHTNVDLDQNDVQWDAISTWLDTHFKKDIIKENIYDEPVGKKFLGTADLCVFFDGERVEYKGKIAELNKKLQQTYAEKSEINRKLQITYAEKSDINAKLQKTYKEKAEINSELQRAYQEKTEINAQLQRAYQEKYSRGLEVKSLKNEVETQRIENDRLKNEGDKLKMEIRDIKESKMYRLGMIIARPYWKIRNLTKH